MAKDSKNPAGKRPSSYSTKPYDANNSFVKKMATKVTDFIPQSSWISKWFNTSQDNGDTSNEAENPESTELEYSQKPPPSKRPRIRMDVTHPPGTFHIQPRTKTSISKADSSKEQYSVHDDMSESYLQSAGPSSIGHLISSTPAVQADTRDTVPQRSELNSLVSVSTNGTPNGMDDNSESSESTSGCSSLFPQNNRQEAPLHMTFNSPFLHRKRFHDDKLSFKCSSRETLSSRRPSFNASIMTNTLDRVSPLSSPFYSGNTTFGGANTAGLYKRSRMLTKAEELHLKVPRRASIEVKPSNTTSVDSSGMSQTAKKILEALEHFSSPISDAKKIPLKGTDDMGSPSVSKKRSREEADSPASKVGLRHLTRELTVPTVPDILKLKRRQKLQDTTVAARRIVSARSEQPPPPQEYYLRSEDNDNSKYHGKIKTKSKTNLDEEETVETVNLPSVPLPISSLPSFNFVPTYSSTTINKCATNTENNFKFASPIKVTDTSRNLTSINNFTFSKPISAESKQSLNECNQLSKTLSMETNIASTGSTFTSAPNFIWSNSSTAPRLKENAKDNKDSVQTGIAVASELKSGSVMDVLCAPAKIKSPCKMDSDKEGNSASLHSDVSKDKDAQETVETWECSECLIKNNVSDVRCRACKGVSKSSSKTHIVSQSVSTPNTATTEPKYTTSDCFGSQFKLSTNQWECESCYVRNAQTDIKCVSCSAPRTVATSQLKSTAFNSIKPQSSDLMEKFKPAEGSWECPGCMLRNSSTTMTCPCCSASKPSTAKSSSVKSGSTSAEANDKTSTVDKTTTTSTSTLNTVSQTMKTDLMEKFRPSKDSWNCPSCMVRNADSVVTCPCCNTPKPGENTSSSKDVQKLSTNGFGDKFKKPEGSWSCDSCLLQNDGKNTTCVACGGSKPGTQKADTNTSKGSTVQFNFGIPSNAGNFKFGIDKVENQTKLENASATNGFSFGNNTKNTESTGFTFGIPKNNKSESGITGATGAVATTTASKSSTEAQNSTNEIKSSETNANQEEKKATPLFSFGAPKNETSETGKSLPATTISTISPASTFSFGVQKPEASQLTANKEKATSIFGSTVNETSKTNVLTASSASQIVTTAPTSAPTLITQSNTHENKTLPAFSFGVPNTASTTVSVNNTVTTASVSLPISTQPSFVFSDTKSTVSQATTTSSAFGQSSATTLSNTFSFSGNKNTETALSSSAKKPLALSNSSTTNQIFSNVSNTPLLFANADAKTTPAFGTTDSKTSAFSTGNNKLTFGVTDNKAPVFGATESKPPLFGTSDTEIPAFGNTEKTALTFNAPTQAPAATPTPTPSPLPAFGAPAATSSLFGSSTTPVFGANSPSTFGSGPTPNIFSTTKANEGNTQNQSLFTFSGSSTAAPQQPATGFNFNTNINPPGAAQKPLFTFGSSGTGTQQNSNLFAGGSFNSATPTTTAFTFNAPKPEAPAFGQSGATGSIFGAPQSNPQTQTPASSFSAPSTNAGFNFGSAPAATPSGGFNFGGMTNTSTSSSGFDFSASNPAPTVSFDPNTPPSFNFTGGSVPTAFSATPQSSVPQRKIKKAVRRMR